MPLYIEKINGDVDRPTNGQGEYRAICLFRKLGNRKKAEICNFHDLVFPGRKDTLTLYETTRDEGN